jgi:hypothetical protein
MEDELGICLICGVEVPASVLDCYGTCPTCLRGDDNHPKKSCPFCGDTMDIEDSECPRGHQC